MCENKTLKHEVQYVENGLLSVNLNIFLKSAFSKPWIQKWANRSLAIIINASTNKHNQDSPLGTPGFCDGGLAVASGTDLRAPGT